jgi:hypothetical protein
MMPVASVCIMEMRGDSGVLYARSVGAKRTAMRSQSAFQRHNDHRMKILAVVLVSAVIGGGVVGLYGWGCYVLMTCCAHSHFQG